MTLQAQVTPADYPVYSQIAVYETIYSRKRTYFVVYSACSN